MNLASDRIILVPACLLCQAYMAKNNKTDYSWRTEILGFLTDKNYSVIPLPCPESSFSHPKTGMHRSPHNIRFYEKLEGFQEHCSELAAKTVAQIEELMSEGLTIIAVLGLENSPTCTVDRMFVWGEGSVKRPGIFIQELVSALDEKRILIPLIGIDRRSTKKAINEIAKLQER